MKHKDSDQTSNLKKIDQSSITLINLLEQLPSIIEDFINATCKSQPQRDLDIIKRRFGLNYERVYSLEEIGIYYNNISRERVRQIESKIIKKLSELMDGSSEIKKIRLSENIVQEYQQVKDNLLSFDYILTEEEIRKFFQDRYKISNESQSFASLNFLMELLGYCPISAKANGYRGLETPAWCLKAQLNKAHLKKVFSYLNTLLNNYNRFDFFDIVTLINKNKGHRLDNDFIKMILKLCIEIENIESEKDTYQVKFEYLSSAAEKAFRVLQENGSPLHFSEITKIINYRELQFGKGKTITETSLKNQLILDSRFEPIGRSGRWSLSNWDNVVTKEIIPIMKDSFHEYGKPLSAKEVYQYVIAKRPDASFKSVSVYLNDKDTFVRVERNQYALKKWRDKNVKNSKMKTTEEVSDLINPVLKEVFTDQDSILLAELIRLVHKKTKLSENTIRDRIYKYQNLELKKEGATNRYTVYCIDKNFEKVSSELYEGKLSLRDKVQNEILSILQANPNQSITKGDLYNKVKKEINDLLRPTFYQYLSEMKDIKQYQENGKNYCLFEYEEKEELVHIDSSLLDKCSDQNLLTKLKRAIDMLNINEVDLGLFELGRIFENELKDYLIIAKHHSVIQVYKKDTQRLVSMINCVEREQVVSKGYYLHILRDDRNNRAHGNVPSLEERKNILNKAHYIAELYVRNIILFNNKKLDILK